ncbi:MAG: hypothetical protein QM401_07145 [Bacillota bacterium]|nr:hypothetical protein [Bacillota bacterium]
MKTNSILISVILVLAFGSVVLADSIDVSTSFHEHHILEVELTPDPSSDVVFILNYGAKTKSTILDGEEELVSLGDFQVVEGHKNSVLLALGLKTTIVTPWVGVAKQANQIIRYEMERKESNLVRKESDLVRKESDLSTTKTAPAFGVNIKREMGSIIILGTIAKVPQGILANTKVKYSFSNLGTIHLGYSFDSQMGHGIIGGLGLSY